MENQSVLYFSWDGDPDGKENWQLGVYVNGQEIATSSYTEGWFLDIPLSEENCELKLIVDKGDGRKHTNYEHTFQVNPESSYRCDTKGSANSSSKLQVKFAEEKDTSGKASPKGFILSAASLFIAVVGIIILYVNVGNIDTYPELKTYTSLLVGFTATAGAIGMINCILNLKKIKGTDQPKLLHIIGIVCFLILLFVLFFSTDLLIDKFYEDHQFGKMLEKAIFNPNNFR